ncbi:MAG: DUF748 domain-containing protein, partial [Candidatus Rokubacteria bacterium]|nr:DUF748 domain-containing protein [Candidatus Rokubacteria bacterium]
RLDARLDVAWARGALEADGPLVIRELTVRRAGQDAPLVEHARLDARVDGLRADASGVSVARVAVAGTPVIVDGSASPPLRVALDRLRLEARHVTWPGRRPIELEGEAAVERGGTATLTGTLHPGTLATDVRLAFANVDVTRAAGYLPAAAPVTVEGGRAAGTVRLRRADATPLRLDGGASVTDLALTLTAGPDTRVVDDRLTVTVEGLALSDGAVAAGRLALDASPALGRADEAGQPFALHAELRDLAWPGGAPAALRVRVGAGEGSLEASGTFVPSTRMLEATVTAANAALAPFAPLLPIDAGMGGRLDARLRVSAQPGAAAPVTARGDLTVHDAHLGPADTAPVRAAAVRVEGLALEGRTLEAARVTLAEPSILIEREDDGSFPLRAMLTPDAGGAASPPAPDGAAAPTPASARGGAAWKVAIDDLRVVDGRVRFVDRTTRPFYSEEITELAVTVRDLATDERRRAGLVVQGIVGVDAALDLRGEIAPFASPFFLEVSGELSDFAVPRTNPYLQRFLDWIAQRGQLTTRLHYRIVGTELEATNELVVRRLDVAPARDGKRAEQLVGLPIGLVVALLKDASGDIRFTLPVSGELGSPRFSFGDAVRSALSNVLGRLVTAPFRAIGSVVRGGGGGDAEARIDPVTFPPGNATLTPDAAAHLQRVADFLRASPYVSVAVEGVVSARDVEALRAREVVARIQALQRDEALDSFAEAARRLWRASSPEGPAPPEETRAIVDGLAQREPPPSAAARELAQRRESVSRTHLVEAAGIPRARVVDTPASTPAGVDGEGRVEFRLVPSS